MIIFTKKEIIRIIMGLQPDYFSRLEFERNGFGKYYDYKLTFEWNKTKLEEYDLDYLEILMAKLLIF